MDKQSQRKKSYKAPSTDPRLSQETRRAQALEDQKRKRLQRVDSARQLDLFADLNLGLSDGDDEDDVADSPDIVREGIGQFAPLLASNANPILSDPSTCAQVDAGYLQSRKNPNHSDRKKRGHGGKGKGKRKSSKWADKCMYAELLEMHIDASWTTSTTDGDADDGLPLDLETGWIALAPVPLGKRCLAVTQHSAGASGVAPNTTLRSRLLGKVLLAPFPTPLPPSTILDCILDAHWRENGLLHVLDVISWKGQDIAGCEAGFRFWWRDTRLAELDAFPPPASSSSSSVQDGTYSLPQLCQPPSALPPPSAPSPLTERKYIFPYPTSYVPVPYTSDTTYTSLVNDIIPRVRAERVVNVVVPVSGPAQGLGMGGAPSTHHTYQFTHIPTSPPQTRTTPHISAQPTKATTELQSDGLLLYVARASYEPGTSPLSAWVPIHAYETGNPHSSEDVGGTGDVAITKKESPLTVFERLVRRRSMRKEHEGGITGDVEMDIETAMGTGMEI